MLRSEPGLVTTGPTSTVSMTAVAAQGDAGGGVFDFDDLQALREEYEDRLRRLERDKDAALDVMRKDVGQRLAAMRAEQDTRLAAQTEMRQQLIEELTIELASAREEGEHTARDAERRRVASEDKLRWALGEVDRLVGELARVREVLVAHLTPAATPVATEPPALPADALVTSTSPATAAMSSALAARRKKIRLR